jgi:hypothetical protein
LAFVSGRARFAQSGIARQTREYFTDVLDRIKRTADDHLRGLLPDRWKPPSAPPDPADVELFDA